MQLNSLEKFLETSGLLTYELEFRPQESNENVMKLINQFFTVTDDPAFCMETTLICIGTTYFVLPFGSIFVHLG